MITDPWHYFTDPVLRAPTLGSMLMCLASSLVGVLVFIRKRSLVGEALSHAAYPGVVLSVMVAAQLFTPSSDAFSILILIGAFLSSMLGLWVIDRLEKYWRVKSDAALCFVLSAFFGIGILLASRIQVTHALWYKQMQLFLYGQAATMTDIHVVLYGVLAGLILVFITILYRHIQVANFDAEFAKSTGMKVHWIDSMIFLLLLLAIVIGMRSVGVVLMSGMLIAPAAAARQFTHRLSSLFAISGFFGVVSGFAGNYFSVELPQWVNAKFSLPTGPMILLCASTICMVSLLAAPGRGLISRYIRIAGFRERCLKENVLKALWRKGKGEVVSFHDIASNQLQSAFSFRYLIWSLILNNYLEKVQKDHYRLTSKGWTYASRIVRLHRLWEVYLVDYLGQGVEKVHHNAEEMEHIITPELEKELIELLQDPKHDPHHQTIPSKEA